MKRMKTKRFLTLALALVMSLSLAAPAFAASLDDSGSSAETMPPQVYPQERFSLSSGNGVGPFTTTPANGKYLQVWFRNYTGAEVKVILMDGTNSVPLKDMTVSSGIGLQGRLVYEIPTPDAPCTFYIRFYGRNGERIEGDVAARQYAYDPSNPSATEPEDPDEKFTPKSVTLYENKTIKELMKSNYTTNRFTSTPGEGQYIKVWFRNYSKQAATVKLYRTDSTKPVLTFTVGANSGTDWKFYEVSDAAAVSYYVNIDIALNYPISGYLAVAQKNVEN